MDDDVREAMCNPDYDNGELEDDIMQQMMALAENDSDEEETFDYDAHIAKLIAESEGDLGLVDELSSGEEDDDIENPAWGRGLESLVDSGADNHRHLIYYVGPKRAHSATGVTRDVPPKRANDLRREELRW